MFANEAPRVRALARHILRASYVTDDPVAMEILTHAAADLNRRADHLEDNPKPNYPPIPPFNPNPQE